MKKSKEAMSLIIAISLVMVSSLMALLVLQYIIPFSRDIRGVENATIAYYNAYSGIEKSLYFFNIRKDDDLSKETYGEDGERGGEGYFYNTSSSGTTIPLAGKGRSPTSDDYDIISFSENIQLSIGYGLLGANFRINFRVPESEKHGDIDGIPDFGIISWQLAANSDSLSAYQEIDNSIIRKNQIGNNNNINISSLKGRKINGQEDNFSNFYNNNCGENKCILRFSIINEIKGTDSRAIIPYLEWKITSSSSKNLPLRYSIINSEGYAYGFTKKLEVFSPQETVVGALDFAVFQ